MVSKSCHLSSWTSESSLASQSLRYGGSPPNLSSSEVLLPYPDQGTVPLLSTTPVTYCLRPNPHQPSQALTASLLTIAQPPTELSAQTSLPFQGLSLVSPMLTPSNPLLIFQGPTQRSPPLPSWPHFSPCRVKGPPLCSIRTSLRPRCCRWSHCTSSFMCLSPELYLRGRVVTVPSLFLHPLPQKSTPIFGP